TRGLFGRLTNDTAALQNLAATQTTITWTRGGSSSQFTRVTFEYSTDNVNYTPLDNGTATGSNWILTGLNLPTGQNFYIRARGYYRSGEFNSSGSITESVRNVFITTSPTSTVLANISTRGLVDISDEVMIGGFTIAGTVNKTVLLRAIGPSLRNPPFNLTGTLQDP